MRAISPELHIRRKAKAAGEHRLWLTRYFHAVFRLAYGRFSEENLTHPNPSTA